jgi:hypothetical protein
MAQHHAKSAPFVESGQSSSFIASISEPPFIASLPLF